MAKSQLRCIYKITNRINGKFYIGSTTEYERRYTEHFNLLRTGRHYNYYLQQDYNEFGEVFDFKIIEEVGNKEELIAKEQFYLDTMKPDYNILIIADRPTGVKRRDTTKEAIRQANLGLVHPEWRNEIKSKAQSGDNHWTKHKEFSDEAKKKMSESRKKLFADGYVNPRKGSTLSDESKKLIAQKLSKPVLQLTLDGEFVKEWESMNEIQRNTKFDKSCISLCCRGKRKTHGGFLWEFKNE